jgi:molybdopterin molybdotransferase
MISVPAALEHLFVLAAPLGVEEVALTEANGRVLARPVEARRSQPPFAASAMDGYAVRHADATVGAVLSVVGESAAGRRFDGAVGPGQAVRIFTGAPVPEGADLIVIQEDTRRDGAQVTVTDAQPGPGSNIRKAGSDFAAGALLTGPRRLGPSDIALLAAMNIARVTVTLRPVVAIIATGDELVQPGEAPGPDQIIASNSYGLHALLCDLGALPRILPVARDNLGSLDFVLGLAKDADLVLTIGGASVGDHDLVAKAAEARGMLPSFYKVAMRPGKPLMAGRIGEAALLGLPGNPVSAMVCGTVFLAPMIRAMLGLPAAPAPRDVLRLAAPMSANGPREHYLRARTAVDGVLPFGRQDSSLLTVLADADCLIVQPPNDPARAAGEEVEIIRLKSFR